MKYEYWFAKIQGINLRKKIRLRQCMKTAEAIYYIEETQLKKIEFLNESEQDKILKAKRQDPEKEYESLCEKGIRFIPHFTDEYPEKLKRISDYPYALYVKGSLPDKAAKKAALVGARRCTPYGEKYAVDFGKVLAEHGVQIISGMARGVDGMGHRGALLGNGKIRGIGVWRRRLLPEGAYRALCRYIGTRRWNYFRDAAWNASVSSKLSGSEQNYKRIVRCCACYGSGREERLAYYSRSGIRTRERSVCASGSCK